MAQGALRHRDRDYQDIVKANAWYWRHRGDDREQAWEFWGYGRPNAWWLQMEYLEIRSWH